jgi:hypothetical protein
MHSSVYLALFLLLTLPFASSVPRINPHPGGSDGSRDAEATTYLDSISEFLSSLMAMLWETVDWGGGAGGLNATNGAWWGADWQGDGWNGTQWNGTEWGSVEWGGAEWGGVEWDGDE